MIPTAKLKEIKNYIDKSETPLIFFDDDPDGLCSYLIIKKNKEHAKGVVMKTSPIIDLQYTRKIKELSPDAIFVLDRPIISQEFIDSVSVPLIWVDHHPIIERKGVHYYNPRLNDESDNSPISYWTYKALENPEYLWIATLGSIADWYIPDFFDKFREKYPGLIDNQRDPPSIIFESKFGELIKMFSFLLKGRTLDVRQHVSVLNKIKDPYELLEQKTSRGKFLYNRYIKLKKQYDLLLTDVLKEVSKEDILLFIYPSARTSFTSELSNELIYRYPKKLIIIGREKGDEIKLSMRSTKLVLPPILEKALVNVKGYGGGHDHAVGANVSRDDFNTFIDNIKNQIK